mmetsp:Transcript_99839/g.277830  ORF Transcript_99839/g.277830 Transcript_99839/m.277830 type:complete len:244 (+) Transcript_99839:103-834(+)
MLSPRGESSAASTAASSDTYQEAVVKIRPTKLFVGGLTAKTTTKQLRDHFSTYGRIMDCVAMRGPDGKARNFGYVTLDSLEAATLCASQPQRVDGRVVDVKIAVPGRARARQSAAQAAQRTAGRRGGAREAKAAAVTEHEVCTQCAHCDKCRAKKAEGGWAGAWPDAWSSGATLSSSTWNSQWGYDEHKAVPLRMPAYPLLPALLAPPPGLPMPHGTSLFRTPSPSECSSSRSSSPARGEEEP